MMKLFSVVFLLTVTSAPVNCLQVRLRDGRDAYHGRVEVLHNGTWGTVCDDDFGNEACRVVCKQLGHSGGVCIAQPTFVNRCVEKPLSPHSSADYFPDGSADTPIWLSHVTCIGVENQLFECRSTWRPTNCLHKEDVGCRCLPLSTTTTLTSEIPGNETVPLPVAVMLNGSAVTSPESSTVTANILSTSTKRSISERSTCNSDHYKLLPFDRLKPDVSGIGVVAVRRSVVERGRRKNDDESSGATSLNGSEDDFSGDSLEDDDFEALLIETDESSLSEDDNDEWGLICDNTWDDMDASVACGCLGFTNVGDSKALYNIRHGHKLSILIDQVHCVQPASDNVTSSKQPGGLADCLTVPAKRGRCDAEHEAAAVACVPGLVDYLVSNDIVANVTCDANTLKACLTRDISLSLTSSQLSPPCAKAVKQTNDDGFCYVIDMAVCKSVDTQARNITRRQYCYDVTYEDPESLVDTVSMSALSVDDGSGSITNVTEADRGQLIPLRLGSANTRRRFCCDVLTLGNSVSAHLHARHVDKPDLRQMHNPFNFSLSCYADMSFSGSKMIYPAAVNSGDFVNCRVDVGGMWDRRLLLTVPNCTFTAGPSKTNISYHFIRKNCPSSTQLDIQFFSFSPVSVGFRTRIPKFDLSDSVHVNCIAVVCDPLPRGGSFRCDRSCIASSREDKLSSQEVTWMPLIKREIHVMSTTRDVTRHNVQQGPFLVRDTGKGPVIRPDGSIRTMLMDSSHYHDAQQVIFSGSCRQRSSLLTSPIKFLLVAVIYMIQSASVIDHCD